MAAREVKLISLTSQEEAAKIKRRLIIDFLRKYVHKTFLCYKTRFSLNVTPDKSMFVSFLHRSSSQISQYCVRAQIVAYYHSLTVLLEDIPSIRQSHFMIGQPSEPKVILDSGAELCPDPRYNQHEFNALY